MAKRIQDLPMGTPIEEDLLTIVDVSEDESKKISASNFIDSFPIGDRTRVNQGFIRRSGNQAIANGTWTAVEFNATDEDPNGMQFGTDLKIDETGFYLVVSQLAMSALTANTVMIVRLSINGDYDVWDAFANYTSVGNATGNIGLTSVMRLSAGDVLSIQGYQASGAQNILGEHQYNNNTNLRVVRLFK